MHSIGLKADRTAAIDFLRSRDGSAAIRAAGIVGFAILTALGAQVRIYLWEVPFTLQTVAVYGSGLYLGWRNGMLSQLLYLALGLFLPVYAGEGTGVAYLTGAVSAGYLLAYPLAAAAAGFLSRRWNGLGGSMLSMLGASLVLFAGGVMWLHVAAGHASWWTSIDHGWFRFIPADLAKMLLVGLVYGGTRRVG